MMLCIDYRKYVTIYYGWHACNILYMYVHVYMHAPTYVYKSKF